MKAELKPYLAWVGARYYADFEAFAREAEEQGVSKRVPNLAIGKALMEEGVVIFLAHDGGEKGWCPDCSVTRPCEVCGGSGKLTPKTKGSLPFATVPETCEACQGTGQATFGTGGQVVLKDGSTLDFIEYWGRRKHPRKYPELVPAEGEPEPEFHRCETCGGLGTVPLGFIHGMFIPQGIEYVLHSGDDEKVKAKVEEVGARAVTMVEVGGERPRGCGRRKPGGTYLVTRATSATPETVTKIIEEMVAKGMIEPDGAEVKGNFVRFIHPVEIHGVKRFRGIKKWSMDPEVEAEAGMILEAME